MATLKTINVVDIVGGGGGPHRIKQGVETALETLPLELSGITEVADAVASVATGAAETMWDAAQSHVTAFSNAVLWSDQTMQVQVIGVSTNFVVAVAATNPYTLSSDDILAAADTTALTAAATTELVKKIVVVNTSGSTSTVKMLMVA